MAYGIQQLERNKKIKAMGIESTTIQSETTELNLSSAKLAWAISKISHRRHDFAIIFAQKNYGNKNAVVPNNDNKLEKCR